MIRLPDDPMPMTDGPMRDEPMKWAVRDSNP